MEWISGPGNELSWDSSFCPVKWSPNGDSEDRKGSPSYHTSQFQPWFIEITFLSKKAALSEISIPNLQGSGLINLKIQCRHHLFFQMLFSWSLKLCLTNSPEKWLCGFPFIHSGMMDRQASWHVVLGSLFKIDLSTDVKNLRSQVVCYFLYCVPDGLFSREGK